MEINADLHIHGPYSQGTSSKLRLVDIAEGALRKGVELIGTGDCLNERWLKQIRELDQVDEGTFSHGGSRFVLTVEVEDTRRVHHLIIFPSISKAMEFKEAVSAHCSNIEADGRPHLAMDGEEIAQAAKDAEALIGPCHAFTPWTAMYAYHPNLRSCYGDMAFKIDFVELGLSANSDYADRIAELQSLTFLTNSDAHSPAPHRLAREFNRFSVEDATYDEIRMAIKRLKGRHPVLNVGLPPEEGKYNRTACTRCYARYDIASAVRYNWKCPKCGGTIKKGVWDRVNELATWDMPRHPDHRPPYMEIIPLSEIIAMAMGIKNPMSKKVSAQWSLLVERFGSEVAVLVDARPEDIVESGASDDVTNAILAFRNGEVKLIPGGGGQYGRIVLGDDREDIPSAEAENSAEPRVGGLDNWLSPGKEKEGEKRDKSSGQTTLFDF